MCKHSLRVALVLASLIAMFRLPVQAQSFELLGEPGLFLANALSGDGNVVAGFLSMPQGVGEAATWSILDGWTRLFPGVRGSASGISADGTMVVGNMNDGAFIWRANGSPTLFPPPSSAWALDDAAAKFILWRDYAALYDVAAGTTTTVWPSAGIGYRYTQMPTRISRNGAVVIGQVTGSGLTETGFVHPLAGTYIPLLPRGTTPQAISADGTLVAGSTYVQTTGLYEAFVWDANTGNMVLLPRLPGAVITQGRTMPFIGGVWRGTDGLPKVVGMVRVEDNDPEAGFHFSEGEGYAAVMWTNTVDPPRYLRAILLSLNPTGHPLILQPLGRIIDVSPDGNVILGYSSSVGGVWRAVLATSPAHTPQPELQTVAPERVAVGQDVTLTLQGRGFRPDSVVEFDGQAMYPNFVSPTELRLDVPGSSVSAPGTVSIVVENPFTPPPGGRRSNALTVHVDNIYSPVIAMVSPSGVRQGSTGVQLRVQGSYFTPASQIEFDGNMLSTTFVSNQELRASVPDSVLAVLIGMVGVRVYEPSLNDYSNTLPFAVTLAFPAISRLTPNSVLAEPATDLQITVRGSGFEAGAVVYFFYQPIPTTFVSSSELHATVSRSMLSSAGNKPVNVYNPTVGVWSNSLNFIVVARRVAPPPGTSPGGSPSLRMTDAHIVPNVNSQVFVTIRNEGGGSLTNNQVTSATLNGRPALLVPDPGFSGLDAGQSVQLIYQFMTPNIRSGQSYLIRVMGWSSQGTWQVSRIVTVP